jgi:hypothetical protein
MKKHPSIFSKFSPLLSFLFAIILVAGCGTIPLPGGEPETIDILLHLSTNEDEDDAFFKTDLERMHAILLEVFEGEYAPLPEDEIKEYSDFEDLTRPEFFRWGIELDTNPLYAENAGAFVGRTVSTNYLNHIPLVLDGPWIEMFPETYSKFDKTFEGTGVADFVAGTIDSVTCENDVINLADRGIIFAYPSTSLFRRIKGLDLPGGEALLHWEHMIGEADRIEGGDNAYMKFLINFQIYLPLNDTYSFRLASTWTHAGGSILFFSGTANSGDIGKGIRKDFKGLENYLASY